MSTENGSSAEAPGVRSVQRALDILSLLSEERPSVSIRDIVEATGLAKTTVIRLVHTLEQNGLLWAAPSGYLAGPGLWRWAHLARSSWELPPETQKLMRDLGARRRETVNLYMLRDIHRVCIAQQESPQPLRHVVHVGDELPLWAGASSKVLLRDAPESLLRRVARSSPYGEGHVKRLTEWIEEAAHRGWAASHGEREDGLSAVAVPVVGRSGTVVAALSLSGPTVRFSDQQVEQFAKDLRDAARQMSERGFDHPLSPTI
ncbi:IclR family transcriptional regulator [Actinoallomurus iriomotensis]|uniref:IclR family transcriptional regulator n=1 Tax=Actinoallomurus iriomotensis TaxID=478107 RepID=A0A9W6RUH7_9ACTN|nr:IclR family transcriptional regulator [Actinoallomurus iriomotensis]GLY73925.1 IclR family transcriptional regulator [Actinoallomurus iriomotensis]GLY82096.1 IclR family transcriptional regulator [Actinoallomurus iriomotensis]